MKELEDLADGSLSIQILDNEAYGTKIQQIFERVKGATESFFVRTIIIIKVMYIQIRHSQLEMAVNVQKTASQIHDDIKVSI